MNVIFRGKTKEILESMVKEGYANTQSEAVRLAVIDFGEHHLSEVELVNRKLDKLNKDIEEGKSRLLDPKEALGKYAKFLK
ncbi:hypothetical protein KKG83_03315 [Candidatus Micrarchaeota archaeon]|nr:hypothetical protein [Candidatus Micrarchaeota archaeon]MBU2476474.1 hypothetical protein [Candidatus Micrarchaeota archaeon]